MAKNFGEFKIDTNGCLHVKKRDDFIIQNCVKNPGAFCNEHCPLFFYYKNSFRENGKNVTQHTVNTCDSNQITFWEIVNEKR